MNSKIIADRIKAMPPEDEEACNELAEYIRRAAGQAPHDVAIHAVHLVAFEMIDKSEKSKHYVGCPAIDGKPVCTCGGRSA